MLNVLKSDTSRKVASNTIYQLVGKAISMTITIFATVIVTRTYGRDGYGAFSLMQAYPALFFVIVDFGINAIATRELTARWEEAEKYLGNIIIMRFLFSLFLMLVMGLILTFLPYDSNLRFGIYLSLFLILTQSLYATTNIIFQVKLRYDLSTIGYVSGSVIVLGLVLLFSYLHLDIAWVNFSYVLGGLVTYTVNILFIKRLGLNIKLQIDKTLWKYLLLQSWPLGLMFVFSQINFKADAILLSFMPLPTSFGLNNIETTAIYSLPFKIFEVSLVAPTFLMNAVYPIFVKHLTESKEKILKTFKATMWVLFVGGILSGIFGYLFAPFMITVLGGSEFIESVTVLRILLGGVFIFYLTQPLSWLIVTLNGQRYLPWVYLVSAAFNLGGNLWLIPKYSYIASSTLTWVSEIIILVLLLIFARKVWHEKYKI